MISGANAHRGRWINYAASLWPLLFAAPHVWLALGFPYGFPGGSCQRTGKSSAHDDHVALLLRRCCDFPEPISYLRCACSDPDMGPEYFALDPADHGLDRVCDVDAQRGGGISCRWNTRSCLVADVSPRWDTVWVRCVGHPASWPTTRS